MSRRRKARRRARQAAGDAEVEQRGAAVGQHEQVPAVQVAVEDAVDHGALHEADHAGADDRLGVDAGVLHAGDVVEGLNPSRRSITSTRRVTELGWGRGIT
jgi:hypothetical protein